MKIFALLLPMLFPLLSLAAPESHVGDFAKFHLTGGGLDYFKKLTVLRYDAAKRAYLVETSLTTDEGPEVSQDWMPAKELYTQERGRSDVANCARLPGRKENFTLNGRVYPVCHHSFSGTDSYELVGPFPVVGRARLANEGEDVFVEELVDFGWAH